MALEGDPARAGPGPSRVGERPHPERDLEQLLRDLATGRGGLSSREAARRLQQHGPNEIHRREGRSRARDLLGQFTHPLALLLWAAAALSAASEMAALALAIVAVIVLNALFAFLQELQAERATEALRELLPLRARVRRDGQEAEVDAAALVPGDILLLAEGERISADARLIDGSLEADMSPLTGESQPVARSAGAPARPAATPLDSEDLVFSGCLVTTGEAECVVTATGMATRLGRIAALSQQLRPEASPLQVEVNQAARLIGVIAVAAGAIFALSGTFLAGLPFADSITFAIGVLVANVPEGLLPTITLALAVGVRRMARRRVLVKRLTAVETLGSTDTICTDKTGTLTEGRMAARLAWVDGMEIDVAGSAAAADAARLRPLLRTAVRCNNARIARQGDRWEQSGDPTESALLVAAAVLGEDVEAAQAERQRRRAALFGFDARLKRMTTCDIESGGERWLHTKGAPLELLERCDAIWSGGGTRPLAPDDAAAVRAAFEGYARRGLRVLGFAERHLGPDEPTADRDRAEARLTFLGLIALEDPPRPEVAAAVAACRRAGIRIIVVTGDHALTAAAIARQVGIVGESPRVLSGAEVETMGEQELDRVLHSEPELIVSRSNPETKLHLVDALRHQGHTVAMTGDGVNDAPALRRADIGVAMGMTGTDVAREASTMVLTDDNFASIVQAVEEGRVVYENIRKFVTYIFAHSTPELVPFLLFALSGGAIPLPLTALQILAIDLGTETLPALALGREPAEPGIMARPPRRRGSGIIRAPLLTRAWLWLGLLEAALVTGGFLFVLLGAGWSPGEATDAGSALHHDYLVATTMTFAGITACQVGTAFACRTSNASLWQIGPFSNPPLLWGIGFELAFAAALIYLSPLQSVFATAPLGATELLLLATFPILVWGSDELRRGAVRRRAASGGGRVRHERAAAMR